MRVYRDDIANWFTRHKKDKSYVNKPIKYGTLAELGKPVELTMVSSKKFMHDAMTDGGKVTRTSTDDCDESHVEIEYSKADVMDEQWTDAPETTQEDIDRLPNQDDLAELNKITHPELGGACIHCGINPSELDFTDDYEFQPEGRIWKPTSTDLDLSEWVFEHQEGANSITLDGKIIVDCENTPMLLHEIAHAITGEGHTGYFADRFTELVKLNMEDTSTDDLELGTTNAEATKYYLFGHRKALDLAIQFMFEKLGEDKDGKDFKRWLKAREDE